MSTVIDILKQRQQDEGWSDQYLAQRLGISRVSWWRMRSGKHGMSAETLLRLMVSFPEYRSLANTALASCVASGTHSHDSQKQMLANDPDTAMNPRPAHDDESESRGRNAA